MNIKGNKEKEGYAAVSCNHVLELALVHIFLWLAGKRCKNEQSNFLHTNELFVLFFSRV